MFKKLKFGLYLSCAIIITLGLSISLQSLLAAWTAPTGVAPTGNVYPPINQGTVTQTIGGGLTIGSVVANGLSVTGNSIFNNNLTVIGDLCIDADCKSSWPTSPVTSVFGRTGVVVQASGDYTTTLVTEGANLYFTDTRARAAITGGASTITAGNLTANRALTSDASGKVAVSAVTDTELGYVDGVTSAIQTQLGTKAPIASPTFTGNVTMPGTGIWNSSGNVGIGTNPGYKLDVSGDIHTTGQLYGNGSASTYGALSVNGIKNGWSGINFRSGATNHGTLMMHPSYSGFYNGADNNWRWYVTDAGDVQNYGNITFTKNNPYLSAPSYFVIPGGAYFNSGTVYAEAAIQARGGIHNDANTYLTISGGTSGDTYFSGNVGIGTTATGGYKLNVNGAMKVQNGLDVGNTGGAYTYITMRDDESPNGVKYIHANSNVIGFLNGSGNWISYWDNSGNMNNVGGASFGGNVTVGGYPVLRTNIAYYNPVNGTVTTPYLYNICLLTGIEGAGRESMQNCVAAKNGNGTWNLSAWVGRGMGDSVTCHYACL